MRRDLELAWAAGFFDGEGTTHCAHRRPGRGRSLHFTVTQKNRDNLVRFRAALGDLGRIGKSNARGLSRFRAYGVEAQECIVLLWPYLGREKQDQALRALLAYVWRSAFNHAKPGECHRGHRLDTAGVYVDPRGRIECATCRAERRTGPLERHPVTAIERRIGVREYAPVETSAGRCVVRLDLSATGRADEAVTAIYEIVHNTATKVDRFVSGPDDAPPLPGLFARTEPPYVYAAEPVGDEDLPASAGYRGAEE